MATILSVFMCLYACVLVDFIYRIYFMPSMSKTEVNVSFFFSFYTYECADIYYTPLLSPFPSPQTIQNSHTLLLLFQNQREFLLHVKYRTRQSSPETYQYLLYLFISLIISSSEHSKALQFIRSVFFSFF